MKALSVKQPWAWAIIYAGKDIENRDWYTKFRGTIAIHASAAPDRFAQMPYGIILPERFAFKSIIGLVDIVDVVTREDTKSKWFNGIFGFVLENPRPLKEPIIVGGQLNFWNVSEDIENQIKKQLK